METAGQILYDRLLAHARADFDRIRWERPPITAQLVHRASNAEAEGVRGVPRLRGDLAGIQGAGRRDFYQRFDDAGNPVFRGDPIFDAEGKPITNSAGEPFDVVMPASRTVMFAGQPADFQLVKESAERAGRIFANSEHLSISKLLAGWSFSTPADYWWALIFEFAWARVHPLLDVAARGGTRRKSLGVRRKQEAICHKDWRSQWHLR